MTRVHHHYGVAPPSAITLLHITERAQSFLAFASIDTVHIIRLSSAFPHQQSLKPSPALDHPQYDLNISAIAGHPTLGLIAVALTDCRLFIYSPTEINESSIGATWSILVDRTLSEPVTALGWINSYLIIGSRILSAISITDWTPAWSLKCSYVPIKSIVPSPDHHCIATSVANDSLVKVWVSPSGGPLSSTCPRLHSFHYLPHPHPVTTFSWRRSKTPRVLMTNCTDGVARLWIWSSKVKQFQLHLTLDPRLSLPSESNLLPPACSWLHLESIAPKPILPLYLSNSSFTPQQNTATTPNPNLVHFHDVFDDLVLSIQSSGTVIVYGIQNLSHRQGPISATVIKVIPQCAHPSIFSCLSGAVTMPLFVQFAFKPSPQHILLLGSSVEGTLSCFSVDVDDLMHCSNANIRLVHAWAGHTSTGNPTLHSYEQSLVSMTLGSHHAIVWDLENNNPALRQTNGLKIRAHLTCPDNTVRCVPVNLDDGLVIYILNDGKIQFGERSIHFSNQTIENASQPFDVSLVKESNQVSVFVIHQTGISIILFPELKPLLSKALDIISGAQFANRKGPFHAATLSRDYTLLLWNVCGNVVHEQTLYKLEGQPVLELVAANYSIVLRTPDVVHIYSIGLVDMNLELEYSINLSSTNHISMTSLPTGTCGVLAIAHTHHVSVYARRIAGTTSSQSGFAMSLHSVEWGQVHSINLNTYIDRVTWTSAGDLVAMSGHTLIVVDALPTFMQLALESQCVSPDAPGVLREWLRWNKPTVVKAILNQKYHAIKHGHTKTPLVPWKIISNAAGIDAETGMACMHIETPSTRSTGEELDALFSSSSNGLDMDLLDTKNLNLDKVNALCEVLEKRGSIEDKQLLAILDTISEPEFASMDENGQRFRWEVLLYIYAACRGVPLQPLSSESIAFAYFSDNQVALVEHIVNATIITWDIACALGTGWWLIHPEALRSMAEAIARNHWRKSSNPHDCFLLYLALGKRKLLLTLWKQANGHPEQELMINFLSKDVTDAWKKQALKNAFVLIGKQRFELAAAFFLLADAPMDTVTVCLRNLKDPQLALFIVKLLGVPLGPVIEQICEGYDIASDVSLSIMANWMDGNRCLAMESVSSPSSYLLMQSIESKIQVNYLTSSLVDPTHRRQAAHRAVGWYHVRGVPYLNCILMSKLVVPAQTKRSNLGMITPPEQDDFVALFGANDLLRPPPSSSFDDLFGTASSFTDLPPPSSSFLDNTQSKGQLMSSDNIQLKLSTNQPNPALPLDLLTSDQKVMVSEADLLLALWQVAQSIFAVGSTELSNDLYFDDYITTILDQIKSISLTTHVDNIVGLNKLCQLTISPNTAFQIGKPLDDHLLLSLLMRVFAQLMEQDSSLSVNPQETRPSYCINALVQCIMSLGAKGPETPCKQSYAAIATTLFLNLKTFLSLSCYRAVGIIMKNLPPFAMPTGNHPPATSLKIMHVEIMQYIDEESLSRHLILEYLTLRSFQAWLDGLVYEYLTTLDVASLVAICDICQSSLVEQIKLVHEEVHHTHTLIQSPADDWLTSSHQELFNTLKWEKSWLDDLRITCLPKVPNALELDHHQPAIPLDERFLRLGVHNSAQTDESEPQESVVDPAHLPSSVEPLLAVKIDTIFKHDSIINGMALGPSQSNLVVAQAKSVAELDVQTTHKVMQRLLQGPVPASEPVVPIPNEFLPVMTDSPTSFSPESVPFEIATKGINATTDDKTELKNSPHLEKLASSVASTPHSTTMETMKRGQKHMPDFKISTGPLPESGVLDYYSTTHAHVASHPLLDYYVVADWIESNSVLSLRHYGGRGDKLRIPYGVAKINKLEIDPVGGRFAVGDTLGDVTIFGLPSLRIFSSFPCHARYTSDLVFYGSSTLFISAGSSPGHVNNVALWDTLVPVQSARVRGYAIHESGASAIAYDGRLVYSGGKKDVLDMRHSRPLCSIQAHGSAISCMNVSAGRASLLYTGSVDGTLKVWDVSTALPSEVATFRHLHGTRKFLAVPSAASLPVSSIGLTKIIAGDGFILTSGADGAVKWLH